MLPGEVPKQHEGLGRRWDLDLRKHSSTGHRQAFVSTASAARGGNGGLSWPSPASHPHPPNSLSCIPRFGFAPAQLEAGEAPRVGSEDLGCEAWAPALPWSRSSHCHSSSGGGLCEAIAIQPCVGTRPWALAKGSHVGGLKSAACMASFTGTPTPPSRHLLTTSHEPGKSTDTKAILQTDATWNHREGERSAQKVRAPGWSGSCLGSVTMDAPSNSLVLSLL